MIPYVLDELTNGLEGQVICRDIVIKALECLTEREEEVIIECIFFKTTYRELGEEWGITGGRVGQILQKALRKIKLHLRKRHHIAEIKRYWEYAYQPSEEYEKVAAEVERVINAESQQEVIAAQEAQRNYDKYLLTNAWVQTRIGELKCCGFVFNAGTNCWEHPDGSNVWISGYPPTLQWKWR